MGNTGRNILWIVAAIFCIPTCFLSMLIAACIDEEFYRDI